MKRKKIIIFSLFCKTKKQGTSANWFYSLGKFLPSPFRIKSFAFSCFLLIPKNQSDSTVILRTLFNVVIFTNDKNTKMTLQP